MKPINFAAAALAAAVVATPLQAQTADWSGPYVGGRLGYTSQPEDKNEIVRFDTNLDGRFDDTVRTSGGANAFPRGFCGGAASSATTNGCSDRDGTEWAVHAGYDSQFGPLVIGIVGEYGRSTIVDSVTAFSSTPAFYTFTRRLRDHASARARVGFATGNTLVYGTLGPAYGKIRRSFSTSNRVNSVTESGGNGDAWGYRAGGGVEQKVSDNFSIGVQYLYTSLKDTDDYTVRLGGANVPVSNPFILRNPNGTDFERSSRRFNSNNVSVVASFRF
jgi:outer membrane immunogenic protein